MASHVRGAVLRQIEVLMASRCGRPGMRGDGWFRASRDSSRDRERPRRSSAARFRPEFDRAEDRILLATLTVMNASDGAPGSLRATIAAAPSGDTIDFGPALNGEAIDLTSGPIAIGVNLDIEGPGPLRLAVSGDGKGGVFDIANPSESVTIDGLSIVDGLGPIGGTGRENGFGGRGVGGTIEMLGASLSVQSGEFLQDLAQGGAGAADDGPAGSSSGFGGGGIGGAIDISSGAGTFTVDRSTFGGDSAMGGAGADGQVDAG